MVASQRKYICSFCAKAFSRSEHKARHERSHMGSKPFSCGVCSHSFVRRDLLQRHIRTVHKNTLASLLCKSKSTEAVINSLIKVSNVGLSNDRSDDNKLNGFEETSIGTKNATKIEYLSSSENGSDTNLVRRSNSNDILSTPIKHTFDDHLPMTPTDDDDIIDANSFRIKPKEVAIPISTPITLNSEALKTIFVGRFKNILDDPEKMLNQAFSYLEANSLFLDTVRLQWENATSDEQTFDLWCRSSPLPLALLSVNLLQVTENERKKDFLLIWQTCWQQSMKNSYEKSFLPLSLLIHVHLHSMDKMQQQLSTTPVMYQHILYSVVNSNSMPLHGSLEVWTVFDIFVNLILKSQEFTETSTLIYQWFLKQILYGDLSLSQCLEMTIQSDTVALTFSPSALAVLNQALLCETIMFDGFETHFKNKDTLHTAIILINRLASTFLRYTKTTDIQNTAFNSWKTQVFILHSPAKFVEMINAYCVNPSTTQNWHLYIATWFEFIQAIISSSPTIDTDSWEKFHLSNRWFLDNITSEKPILQSFKEISLNEEKINNNLAICSLSIISILQQDCSLFDGPVKKLIFDVLLFQIKLFGTSLYLHENQSDEHVNYSMRVFKNPIVQLLLFVWYCYIYHKSDGMPKVLYRKGTPTDVDGYTMENYSVSHFIKKYIVLSKKRIDTDALVENDFKKLLFVNDMANEDDFVYFKGYHFLLSRILETIISHFRKMFSVSDPESKLVNTLFEELKILLDDIQDKVQTCESSNSAKPTSPILDSALHSTTTPPEESKRYDISNVSIIQQTNADNHVCSQYERSTSLTVLPHTKCGCTNKSNFEMPVTGSTDNEGGTHIYLPPPVPQQGNLLTTGVKCSLPPASTFLNIS